MSVSRIAKRYARSVLELAQENGILDKVLADMELLKSLLRNKDVRHLLKSPIIADDKKEKILKELLESRMQPLSMHFVLLLVKKQREPFLKEIIEEFIKQYKDIRNIHTLKLRSANKMSEAEINTLIEKLRSLGIFDKGTFEIEQKVDESLIGGFILEYGDFIYDATVSHQLDTMRRKQFHGNLYRSMIRAR